MMPLTIIGSAIREPGVLKCHFNVSEEALPVLRMVSLGLFPWCMSLYMKRGQSPDEAKGAACDGGGGSRKDT